MFSGASARHSVLAAVADHPAHKLCFRVNFIPAMRDEDIKNIIRELVERTRVAIQDRERHHVGNTFVIMFEACYDSLIATGDPHKLSDAQRLAQRVLALGWEGLGALPILWGAATVWYFFFNEGQIVTKECLSAIAEITNLTKCVADGKKLLPALRLPNLEHHFADFKQLYPDLCLLPQL